MACFEENGRESIFPILPSSHFCEGGEARKNGETADQNPYTNHTSATRDAWLKGWTAKDAEIKELDMAKREGEVARSNGVPLSDNPYPRMSFIYDTWRSGWFAMNKRIKSYEGQF